MRYNAADEALRCIVEETFLEGYNGSPDPDADPAEADLFKTALPEAMPIGFARGSAAFGVIWDTWGPFDRCPGLGR